MHDLDLQLRNHRLTTAEVLYELPDFPDLLQTFTWQFLDVAPDYPRLMRFVAFWKRNIQAPIRSVRVANRELISVAELRYVGRELRLH
ncbi:MAG: Usg family protein [Alphaproteobacteria bacterium]